VDENGLAAQGVPGDDVGEEVVERLTAPRRSEALDHRKAMDGDPQLAGDDLVLGPRGAEAGELGIIEAADDSADVGDALGGLQVFADVAADGGAGASGKRIEADLCAQTLKKLRKARQRLRTLAGTGGQNEVPEWLGRPLRWSLHRRERQSRRRHGDGPEGDDATSRFRFGEVPEIERCMTRMASVLLEIVWSLKRLASFP
jgi:hypothetical protein